MMGKISNLLSAREAFQAVEMSDLLFPIDEGQREKLQMTVLSIYKDIMLICQRIDVTPFLVGGSALGAIRHQGFIPWDDDLDVGLLRDEYEAFLNVFPAEFSDKYIVNSAGRSENAKMRFTKVMLKGTICKELLSPADDSINGIFVDVFPIDNVPDNSLYRNLKGHYCNFLEFISSQVFYKEVLDEKSRELLKRTGKASYYARMAIGSVFGFRRSSKWFSKLDKTEQWKDSKSKCCSIVPGRKHYFGEIIDRSIIMPPRYVDFCDIKAPVFHDVDKYLSNMYGNYMNIPPVEKREKHMVKELNFGD